MNLLLGRPVEPASPERGHPMRTLIVVAALLIAASAQAAERRSRLESDECSRQSLVCEQACESREGMKRLECKTDCRLAETRCRNGSRR